MIGLALEGGGTRGSYQLGAYLALKKCHIHIKGVCGTSIGSFNAAMISAGKIKELTDFWLNDDMGKIMSFTPEYTKFMNEDDQSLGHKLKGKTMGLSDFIKNKGLKIDGLRNRLDELVTDEEIRKSKMDFGLCTFRVKDLKPLYLFKEDIPEGKINDYVIASCYLPVFNPVKLDGNSYYIDGGIYDGSPSNMLENRGYKKIYIICLEGGGYNQKKIGKAELIMVKPSKKLGSVLNVNQKEIAYNYKLGYYDTLKVVKKLDGYKYIFKKYPNIYYKYIVRKVSSKSLNYVKKMFVTDDLKEVIIKSIEFIFKEKNEEYPNIYDIRKELKKLQKETNNHGVYKFIKELKLI